MLEIDSANTAGTVSMVNMFTAGARPRMTMTHGGTGTSWNFDVLNVTGNFSFIRGGGGPEFTFDATSGNFTIGGGATTGNISIPVSFISNGMTLTVPDYVFSDDYDLMPLDDVKAFIDENSHLPEVPSAADVKAEGLDMTDMQMTLAQEGGRAHPPHSSTSTRPSAASRTPSNS